MARIPEHVIKLLERAGLVAIRTTIMNGVSGIDRSLVALEMMSAVLDAPKDWRPRRGAPVDATALDALRAAPVWHLCDGAGYDVGDACTTGHVTRHPWRVIVRAPRFLHARNSKSRSS